MQNFAGSQNLFRKIVLKDDNKAEHCQTPYLHETVILPSFHRCGNTLIRELLEGVTGILTGSDDNHKVDKITALGEVIVNEGYLYFKGQWTTDQSVWVYKTHYPARSGKGQFEFDKILLVVRNPFDALDSMFNLYLTNSHNRTIKKEEYSRLFHDWEGLIKEESIVWNKFYEYWINFAINNNVQMLIVKYEELIMNTKGQVMDILKFLLSYQHINQLEDRVDLYLKERRVIYKPRKGTSFHSLPLFNEDQIKFVLENCARMLKFFGYESDFGSEIDKAELNELYSKIDINSFEDVNKITLLKQCLNEEYPYNDIKVPFRNRDPFVIDSLQGLLKYCGTNRSGNRVARLTNEVSSTIQIEEEDEKNKDIVLYKD